MGHEDSTMALTVYSGGLRIEPLVESINRLTYGEELDSFIKEALTEKSNGIFIKFILHFQNDLIFPTRTFNPLNSSQF
jgi:hypothetical protein